MPGPVSAVIISRPVVQTSARDSITHDYGLNSLLVVSLTYFQFSRNWISLA